MVIYMARRRLVKLIGAAAVLAGLWLILQNFLLLGWINYAHIRNYIPLTPRCEVPLQIASHDQNNNGVADALDIVQGARAEVKRGTVYDASYYSNGYPPEGRGACTDVIWRAYKEAGYDLKALLDQDIKLAPAAYGPAGSNPEPAIDFRRATNLQIFFSRHGQSLTTDVKPGQVDNLVEWQPGDIVLFDHPKEHIGIISDRRRRDGVPLLIHNAGPQASEGDYLLTWPTAITGHYRCCTGAK